jgi:hypothetical protein
MKMIIDPNELDEVHKNNNEEKKKKEFEEQKIFFITQLQDALPNIKDVGCFILSIEVESRNIFFF